MTPTRSRAKAQHLIAAALVLPALTPLLLSTSVIAGVTLIPTSVARAQTADDYLQAAKKLLGVKGREQEVIELATKALAIRESVDAYVYRAHAKSSLKDYQGSIADYTKLLEINPGDFRIYINRGNAKSKLGDYQSAMADYSKALEINPRNAYAYYNRGNAKNNLKDYQGAIADYSKTLEINPKDSYTLYNRGVAKNRLNDKRGACDDFKIAGSLGQQQVAQYLNSEEGAWCRNMQ